MSLADLTGHLEDLASSESGLRRSRAMAQLWTEIRSSDVEERRAFAIALADRFAPSLSVKFAETTGLDGPEFIRLVRSLIEMDGEDINSVVSDLTHLVDNPKSLADDVTVAELIETADQLTDESGRDELMNVVFERLVDATDEMTEPLDESLEPEVFLSSPDAVAIASPAPPADIGSSSPVERVTPFDLAMERMADIDELDEAGEQSLSWPVEEPEPSVRESHISNRRSVSDRLPSSQPTPAAPQHSADVSAAPDGWRRRRLISSLIRDGRVSVGEALALSEQLSSPSDVRWVIGDLIERGLTLSDRALVASRELPPNLRRRLEHSSR